MTSTNRVTLTYELAMAAGKDLANDRMRKAGRTRWTRADYNAAVRLAADLMKRTLLSEASR